MNLLIWLFLLLLSDYFNNELLKILVQGNFFFVNFEMVFDFHAKRNKKKGGSVTKNRNLH